MTCNNFKGFLYEGFKTPYFKLKILINLSKIKYTQKASARLHFLFYK